MGTTVITGAHLLVGDGQEYACGNVWLETDKIQSVAAENIDQIDLKIKEWQQQNIQVIDARGKVITPGLIEVHGHIGICEEGLGWEGDDTNEMTDPSTPYVRALDAVNPFDRAFADALAGGVTTVHVMPGSANVIGGETVVMKTHGQIAEAMIVREHAGMKVAFGENPKRVYGDKKQMPSTRMGTAAILRRELTRAQEYQRKLQIAKVDSDKLPDRDLGMEALLRVLRKEMPLRAHAHRADDMVTALRIAREFDVEITLEHATEAHKLIDYLIEQQVKLAIGPTLSSRSKIELQELNFKTIEQLSARGVDVSILTDHPVIPIQYITICAALAIRAGISEQQALQAITLNPARHLQVDERVGSIEAGKDADLVIWDGDPFAYKTKVEQTWINGVCVYIS